MFKKHNRPAERANRILLCWHLEEVSRRFYFGRALPKQKGDYVACSAYHRTLTKKASGKKISQKYQEHQVKNTQSVVTSFEIGGDKYSIDLKTELSQTRITLYISPSLLLYVCVVLCRIHQKKWMCECIGNTWKNGGDSRRRRYFTINRGLLEETLLRA